MVDMANTKPSETNPATYTYTIFDADPNQSGGCAWDTHTDVEIEADDDDEARELVRDALESEAVALNASDYDVGDMLYGMVWAPDGTALRTVTYELTAEDLGVEEDEIEDDSDDEEYFYGSGHSDREDFHSDG